MFYFKSALPWKKNNRDFRLVNALNMVQRQKLNLLEIVLEASFVCRALRVSDRFVILKESDTVDENVLFLLDDGNLEDLSFINIERKRTRIFSFDFVAAQCAH